jgi:hypothetical protein
MHDWADGRVGGTQTTQICDHHRRHRHAQATAQNGGYLKPSLSSPHLTRMSAAATCS